MSFLHQKFFDKFRHLESCVSGTYPCSHSFRKTILRQTILDKSYFDRKSSINYLENAGTTNSNSNSNADSHDSISYAINDGTSIGWRNRNCQ